MTSNVSDPVLSRDSFGTPAIRTVFDDCELACKYVEAEVALAKAQARCDVTSEAAAQETAEKCNVDMLDFDLLCHETEIVDYPALLLVHQISRQAGESGGHVRWGTTTQDIMDIAVVLQIRDTFAFVESDMDKLRVALANPSRHYCDTPMAGRIHLQQALSVTFGYEAAIWLDMSERHAERLPQVCPRILVGEFAGAAGILASLRDKGLAIQKATMEELGLNVPTPTWRVARDGLVEAVNLLAVIIGSLGKIAYDVILLAVNEFDGLYEPFVRGRGTSSTMPQKHNPISSELMLACVRGVRQQAGLMLDAMVQDLEHATGSWHAEWIATPEGFMLSVGALHQANFMLVGLVVDEEATKRNLGMTNGLIVAEVAMMGLAPYIDRQDAHDVVYDVYRIVDEQGGRLADVLNVMPSVSERLDSQLIEELTDPANYLGMAPAMVDQILARYMSWK